MTFHTLIPAAIFVAMGALILQRKHMLMTLLCLEMLILSIVLLSIFNFSNDTQNTAHMFIILLTLGACEASLGLALLVSMTRYFGSDMLNALSNNKC